MDAITLLTEDHKAVRRLFEQFKAAQDAGDDDAMKHLAATIFDELDVHTTIEEEIFYPGVKGEEDDIDETVEEGIQEHHVVDVLMNEMRDLTAGSDEWVAKMTVLIENVEHHADEEEEDLFPDVREALGQERVDELGAAMEERKTTAEAELATKAELYEKAQQLDIEGRSEMTKAELAEAVAAATG